MQTLARLAHQFGQTPFDGRVDVLVSLLDIPLTAQVSIPQLLKAGAQKGMIAGLDEARLEQAVHMGQGAAQIDLHQAPVPPPVVADGEAHHLTVNRLAAVPDRGVELAAHNATPWGERARRAAGTRRS